MMRFLVLLGFCCSCALASEWTEVKAALVPACERYVAAYATPAEVKAWTKKMDDRVAQRLQDGIAFSEDDALRGIALDWAVDHRGAVERRERAAMTVACLLFVRFAATGASPPAQVLAELTVEKARTLAQRLDEDVKEGK